MERIGKTFAQAFGKDGITKVVTIEASGIPPALETARQLQVPMVFLKKAEPSTMLHPISDKIYSFTKQKTVPICMEEGLVTNEDKVLFVDDFLANGEAFKGFERLMEKAGARIGGCAICIEKTFQPGPAYVKARTKYVPLCSVAGFRDGSVILE